MLLLTSFNNQCTGIFSALDTMCELPLYTLPGCGVCGQDAFIGPVMDIGGYWNQMFISTLWYCLAAGPGANLETRGESLHK